MENFNPQYGNDVKLFTSTYEYMITIRVRFEEQTICRNCRTVRVASSASLRVGFLLSIKLKLHPHS